MPLNSRLHASILVVTLLSTRASANAADDPAAPAAAGRDLVSIARTEAQREAATLHARLKTLLGELSVRDDDLFVMSRLAEISRIGSIAIDDLVKAMDHADSDKGNAAQFTGRNAARALARISGQAVNAALIRLAKEGGIPGQRNTALAIGERGDPTLAPIAKGLLASKDKSVVAEALGAIGRLGGPDAVATLLPYVKNPEPSFAAIAIASLARLDEKTPTEDIAKRLESEMKSSTPVDAVLIACFDFYARHPLTEALESASHCLDDNLKSAESRRAAAGAVGAIGKKYDNSKRKAIVALSEAVKTSSGVLLEHVALELRELGDSSGIDSAIAPYDKQIKDEPKNVNLIYNRAEVYLRLREYAKAKRDLLDGWKKEKQKPRQPERVYVALARCEAANDQPAEAVKWFKELKSALADEDFSTLPRQYAEFGAMAADSKYASWFLPSPGK